VAYVPYPSTGGTAAMWEFNNGVLATYDQVNTPHPIIDAAVAAEMLSGWTFVGPLSGNYTAVANAGGGQVTITAAGHGMSAGDVVYLTSSSVAGYSVPNPTIFVVQSVTTNTFNVVATFTTTATGTWHRGCSLVAGAGAAGTYKLSWNLSMSPVGNNKVWRNQPVQNATSLNDCAAESVMLNTGAQCNASSTILVVAAKDVITMSVINETDATDFTARYFNLNLHRIAE
jgi:hypothetical protein